MKNNITFFLVIFFSISFLQMDCKDDKPCTTCPPIIGGDTLQIIESFVTNGVHPAISPDGKKLAFSINGDIYICDTSGFNAKQLTSGGSYDELPQWHPSGSFIGFVRTNNANTNTGLICTVDTNGAQENTIIQDYLVADSLLLESAITAPIWNWSPDGNKVAFLNLVDSVTYLRIFSYPESVEIKSKILFTNRNTNPTHNSSGFSFSQLSNQIIFIAQKANQHTYLFITSADDDTTVKLLSELSFANYPCWTNTNDRVSANFLGEFAILTSAGELIIKTFGNVHKNPKWSPNGKYILSEGAVNVGGANGYVFSRLFLTISEDQKTYNITSTGDTGDMFVHNYFYTWNSDSKIVYYQKFNKIYKITIIIKNQN